MFIKIACHTIIMPDARDELAAYLNRARRPQTRVILRQAEQVIYQDEVPLLELELTRQ